MNFCFILSHIKCCLRNFLCCAFFSPQTGRLTQLSEQALIDCSWGFGNNGCDGGESERSFSWMLDSGCIPSEDSYEGGHYLMQVREREYDDKITV